MIKILPLWHIPVNMLYLGQLVVQKNIQGNDYSLTSCFVGKCKVYNKLYEKHKQSIIKNSAYAYTQDILNSRFDFVEDIIKNHQND